MTERLALRALEHVSAWCVSDTAACKQLSTASNLLWRASLLARAAGGPSEGGARLLGALAPFPRLAPRLQRAHVAAALSLLAGLQSRDGAMGELQAAAERLAGVAGEAGGGGCGGGGGAGLLLRLRQAVAGATGARLQACLEAAGVRAALAEEGAAGGEGGGGGGGAAADAGAAELPPGAALAAAAAKLEALAREWEAGALLRALAAREEEGGLRALEGAVWAATGGARTLRAAVDV